MLSDLLRKSEEIFFVNEPKRAKTNKLHLEELKLLHEICNGCIALHSVETAIQVLVWYLTYQS